jgi:hypothetical protein
MTKLFLYRCLEAIATGKFDLEKLRKDGVIETSPESVAWYKGQAEE